MKVKTQNKSIRKRSIADDFGLHTNNFSLLHSPGRQLSPFGKELLGGNLISNGDFRDFTMEDDANTIGHWIFDKSYEREDRNKYIGSERGGAETVILDEEEVTLVDTNEDGWADGYYASGSSTVTPSLITGNGFTNNAQQVIEQVGGNIYFHNNGLNGLTTGVTYKISFNYTASANFLLRYSSGQSAGAVATNTGTAQYGDFIFTHAGYHTNMYFRCDDSYGTVQISDLKVVSLPAKSLLPVGFSNGFEDEFHLPGYSPNSVANGGGNNATDWIDTNEDGLADDWTKTADGQCSIVTGNGFSTNAQRIYASVTINTYLYCSEPVEAGKYYRLSVKLRSNNGCTPYIHDGASGHSGGKQTADENVITDFSYIIKSTNTGSASIGFYVRSSGGDAQAGDFVEVDEVEFVEVYQENPAYQNGGVLEFNGDDQHLQILAAQAEDFNPGDGSFTIEMWLKGDDTSRAYIWNKTGTHRVSIRYYPDSGAGMLYFTTSDGIILNAAVFTPNNLPGVDWFHLAVVFNKSTGEAIAYKNAVPYSPIDISAWTGSCNPTGNLYIGAYAASNNTFGGHMAEVRYSNVARSLSDIKKSYGMGKIFRADSSTLDVASPHVNDSFRQAFGRTATNSGVILKNLTPDSDALYKITFELDNPDSIVWFYNVVSSYIAIPAQSNITHVLYYKGDNLDRVHFYSISTGDVSYVDNIKVHKVLTSPVSNFAEDFSKGGKKLIPSTDLVPINPTCEGTYTSGRAPSWTQAGTITPTEEVGYKGGSAQGFTSLVVDHNGNIECLSNPSILTAGKFYKISFYNKLISGTYDLHTFEIEGGTTWIRVKATGTWTLREAYWYQATDSSYDADRIKFGMITTSITSVFAIDNIKIEEVSNGNHGFLKNNMGMDQPQDPYSFAYNGVDQQIEFGDVCNVGSSDFIIFLWIKTPATLSAIKYLLSKRFTTYADSWSTTTTATNKFAFYLIKSTGGNAILTAEKTLLTDTWYFMACVANRNDNMYLYASTATDFDTSPDTTNISSWVGISLSNTYDLLLGVYNNSYRWDGKVGDTGIIIFDGTAGRPSSLPSNYEDWITRFYNATKWKYKN